MATIKGDLLKKIRKGGQSESVKRYVDEWVWGQLWDTLTKLANTIPELTQLLDIRAEARVLLSLLDRIDDDRMLAEVAEQRLKEAEAKENNQALPR